MSTLPNIIGVRRAGAIAALSLSVLAIGFVPSASALEPDAANKWWGDDDKQTWSGAGGGWYGGKGNGSRWTPEATRTLQVRDLRIDTAAISPDADGTQDVATIQFRLTRTSTAVAVGVVDAAGATVRQLGTVTTVDTFTSLSWDGLNDAGARVPDGDYRFLLTEVRQVSTAATGSTTTTAATPLATLSLDIAVDTTFPSIAAKRPSLKQLTALAKRAAALRDERARRALARTGKKKGKGHGHGRGWKDEALGEDARNWRDYWDAQQLRLPITFTTGEAGSVAITATVAGRSSNVETWREAGTHTVDVVLPTYTAGKATITVSAQDEAGNQRTHTTGVTLHKLPAPPKRRATRTTRSVTGGSTAPIPSGVVNGPLPNWLDPIMLRATYGAGVPRSWATSQALANLLLRESSYRPTAQNPTSTAYGLFQFLNTTWATVGCTKTSDAYQQSVCGLRYINRRYHTPERAWAFWQANHWY